MAFDKEILIYVNDQEHFLKMIKQTKRFYGCSRQYSTPLYFLIFINLVQCEKF
jgi:hypothetical protein